MPRDFLADRKTLDGMSELSRESATSPPHEESRPMDANNQFVIVPENERKKKIHPFAQLLNRDDLDDCDWLEHAAFDEIEAATREKLEYRLSTCGELCSGLYTSAYAITSGPLGTLIKSRTFSSIDSTDTDRKRVLLGHVIATKSKSKVVTDDSMDYPKDWQKKYQLTPSIGHNEDGRTVCIHSLCIYPDFHGNGFGMVLLKSYVQRIKDSGVASRVALICRDRLVGFYEKAGFKKLGPSKCQYGGGNWVDMVLEFEGSGMDDDDV